MQIFKRWWNKPRPSIQSFLDIPLCWFSGYDPFRIRDAIETVIIFGGVGSGKSSGPARVLALEYLSRGWGGLILCAKIEERQRWENYARETGREEDLIVISSESGVRFNPLDYMMSRKGGASNTENAVRNICDSMDISGGNNAGDSESGSYFIKTKEQLVRNGIDLHRLAVVSLSVTGLFRLVRSAPSLADLENIEWQKKSYCYELVIKARNNMRELPKESADLEDFKACVEFWLDEYPNIPVKTRENIKSTFTSSLEPLTRGELRNQLSTETDVTPEDAFSVNGANGKIIILDYPVKEWLSAGLFIQSIFKRLFQQACEMRSVSDDTLPSFLFIDEAQNFIDPYDLDYFSTSRSVRICNVYITQNVNNLYSKIENRATVDAILANASTKVFTANNDYLTNKWASDHIGHHDKISVSSNSSVSQPTPTDVLELLDFSGGGGGSVSVSSSISDRYAYKIEPNHFFHLKKGSEENKFMVSAIIVQSGRIWNYTNDNYIETEFSQIN